MIIYVYKVVMPMLCNRCEKIEIFHSNDNAVYTYVPTHHHEPLLEQHLKNKGYQYEKFDSYILVDVNDLETYVRDLRIIFNQIEASDIKLLPFNKNRGLIFEDIKNMKTLWQWIDFVIESKDILYVVNQKSFLVMYQPIMNLKENTIYGYEALIRGIDEAGNVIPPYRLFEQAKKMDLVFNLDKAARETIIEDAAKKGLTKQLFINFLPTSIYKPELCLKTTNNAIAKSKLNPSQITFEVVETERIKDYDHLNEILDYYKKQGFQTALDDVGAGYNNKDVIKKLKPQIIKIDRDITANIHENKTNQVILNEYIELANELNIDVLVEGVETALEDQYIKTLNIKYSQGYYYGKPKESL